MKGQQTITDDAKSALEVKTRIAFAASALAILKPFWNDRNITMAGRVSLLREWVTTVFLYGVGTRTLVAEMEKRINAFDNNRMRRRLHIHYTSRTSDAKVREIIMINITIIVITILIKKI